MQSVKSDQGQALIETALSLTILILLTVGAVEFGGMAVSAIAVGNAAKAAAQYAAQSPGTASNLTAMQTAAQNEYYSPSALTLVSPTTTSGYACTCADTGASTSCTINSITSPACPGSYMEVTITVTTQVTYTPIIHIPGLPNSFQLQGMAKQKVLQ
jgi:Flp pilus assembly protein TadG